MDKKYGYKPKAPLLESLLITYHEKSEEEIILMMEEMGYEKFRIPFGKNAGKIAFRRKRT